MNSLLSLLKNTRKHSGFGTGKSKQKHKFIPQLLLALCIVFSLSFAHGLLISRKSVHFDISFQELKEGDISPRERIAPFDFYIPKSDLQLKEERKTAARNVLPVFTLDSQFLPRALGPVDSMFTFLVALSQKHISGSERDSLYKRIAGYAADKEIDELLRILRKGKGTQTEVIRRAVKESFNTLSNLLIVPSKSDIAAIADNLLTLEKGDTISVDKTVELNAAYELFRVSFEEKLGTAFPQKDVQILTKTVSRFLTPNLTFNSRLTADLRLKARESVPVYSSVFKKNERIIDANVPVTHRHLEIFDVLRKEVMKRSYKEMRLRHYASAFGKVLVETAIIGILTGFLYFYRRKVFESFSKLLLLVLISSLPVIITFYTAYSGDVSTFLIPVALSALLVTILFDTELGLLISFTISLFVSTVVPASGLRIGIVYFLTSSIGVFAVGRVRHRKEFYRSMVVIPVVMAGSIVATNDWVSHSSFGGVTHDVFLGILNGFLCPIITIGLLPVLESLFKVTTDITLLELSDLNNPLLKELAVKGPGTYSSVLVLGTMAEAAAEKIGANPLLCRVGAYYHDIGKIVNPGYFIENQMGGDNPHDRLSPYMSALILASHVKEGYELGRKYGLPEPILDIIKQHHGTSLMQSIYHKAVEESGDKAVDEMAFRYPGPKPQTKEAGIVMLADLAEAASRSIKDKSQGRLKALLNTIIQQRFTSGELDECELTLKDLHNIKDSFLPILISSHHGRIEYPWQKKNNDTRKRIKNYSSFHNSVKESHKIDNN